ncbi:MAG: hypothetical protein ACI865_002069 [Flavobacteriaceae bacterium]|jgi:hypothetical protein
MRKRTAAIVLAGALFLLFGSIGINVFFHTCHEDGQFVSYFSASEDHCEADERGLQECCEVDISTEHEEHDCCDDEIKQFKVQPEFYQDAFIITHFDAVLHKYFASHITYTFYPSFTPSSYANPPPISRSERIAQYQSWLI